MGHVMGRRVMGRRDMPWVMSWDVVMCREMS